MEELKQEHVIRNYSAQSLEALIFYPVKAIVFDQKLKSSEKSQLLDELIQLVQRAILY